VNNVRARIAAAAVVGVTIAGAIAGILLLPADATSTVTTNRIAGTTRYDTAKLIGTYKAPGASAYAFGTPSQAVLVSGDDFPDALAAGFLAGAYKSPTFLTAHDTLRPEAVQGLQALGIKQVTIVGGPNAVSSSEDTSLGSDGITSTRVFGLNRDDTAAKVAQANGTTVGTYSDQGLTALLAADNADHYVDALAGGPLSWAGHYPLLLTPTASLAPEAKAALTALKIKHVLILGGTNAVSTDTEDAVATMGITTQRLQGTTRQLTAVAIAQAEHDTLSFTFAHLFLAVGNTFPDALAGGPIGGLLKSPILLTADPNTLTTDTSGFIHANDGIVNQITAFGGQNAIADATLKEAGTTATCASGTTTTTGLGLPIVGGPAKAAAATTTTAANGSTTTTAANGSTTSSTLAPCQTTTTGGPTTTASSGSSTSVGG
jgi:putative cell wall-binding protein